MSAQRRAIGQLLDVVQAAGDATVAIGVKGVEVDAGAPDDAAVQLGAVQNRLTVCVHHTGLGGAVGVDEPGVGVGLITLAVTVAIAQRGLQILQRRYGLAGSLQLALALVIGRLDGRVDLGHGGGITLGDDQADAVLRGAAAQGNLRLVDVQIGHDGMLAGDNLGGIGNLTHYRFPPQNRCLLC